MKINTSYLLQSVVFTLLLLFAGQSATATEAAFDQAAAAYTNGEYGQAIAQYEALTRKGVSSSLLYNLANSYAQNGQTGMAILNYERAARLAPHDSDIQGNLELLRKEKTLYQADMTFSKQFVQLLGLDGWTILATISAILCALVFLFPPLPWLKKNGRILVGLISGGVLVASCLGLMGQYKHYHDGVVIAADARLRISPFESAAASGTILEGRLLTPVKTHKTFTLIRDETGRTGWLANNEFITIVE